MSEAGRSWRRRGIVLFSLAIIAWSLLVPPRSLLGKCDLVGYALCHRIPSHSFHLAGRQLPLCARCTGIYLGTLWVILFISMTHRRGSRFPPTPILALLMVFFLFQAVDGLNSYLALLFHLYEPRNLLRFIAGVLNGLTIGALVVPLFNAALWRSPASEPSIQEWWEVEVLLIGTGGLTALISADIPLLLYPLAVCSALSAVLVLTLVNTTIVIMAAGREGMAVGWTQAWLPLLVGLDLSLLEMGALILMRGLATYWLGFPLSSALASQL
ncbi:MAG: DUF2085 domain-containing protein [Chloroflexota bacterium]|nr:DUF2085 domain-containing protein [Chloroflexota bacterium]